MFADPLPQLGDQHVFDFLTHEEPVLTRYGPNRLS
jgi:hypothetical protein